MYFNSSKNFIRFFMHRLVPNFCNPVKSKMFIGEALFPPTIKLLAAFLHLLFEILCCIFGFCPILFIWCYTMAATSKSHQKPFYRWQLPTNLAFKVIKSEEQPLEGHVIWILPG